MLNLRVLAGLLLIPLAFTAEAAASPSPMGSEDWNAIHRQMRATGKNGYRPMTPRNKFLNSCPLRPYRCQPLPTFG